MTKTSIMNVQGVDIALTTINEEDYICITDMIKAKDSARPDMVIQNWMRNKDTVEFLGLWEMLNNPNFKPFEFEGFRNQAGLNRFSLTPKMWVEKTGAIGIKSRAGRYGGTFAHKDIAMEFAAWISPVFKLYLIKEFQRFKEEELKSIKSAEWLYHRFSAKANYTIQTDAVQKYIIPNSTLPKEKHRFIYASEAELINYGTLGYTAKEWNESNPELAKKGNLREYLSVEELIVLDNMQSFNSYLISQGIDKEERLARVQEEAKRQFASLSQSRTIHNAKEELKVPKKDFDALLISMSAKKEDN